MPEWDAERSMGEADAAALIGEQFPELRDRPVRRLDEGWDNVVHLVDERWVFRFPRRQIAIAGVEREIATLPRLAEHLPLAVPSPRWIGTPTDAFPWPWFGAEHLPGVELAAAGLPDDRRGRLAAELGAFLRRLHDPSLAARVGADLPIDPMRRADMATRIPHTRRRLATVAEAGLWTPNDAVEALVRRAGGLPPPPRVVVLHGDLHARHVLVDGERASGVIDWGDLCTGDPSVDLSIAYGAFAGPARAAFLDAYGPVDGLTELRARVIALFLAAVLLDYAAHEGLDALREESLRSMGRVVA